MGNTGGYLQYDEKKLIENSNLIEVKLCIQIIKELFFDYGAFFVEKEFNKLLNNYNKDCLISGGDSCYHYIKGREYIMFKTFVSLMKATTLNTYKNFDNCQNSLLGIEIEKLKKKKKN